TWVGDEDGLRVVSRCRENLGEVPLNIILIKSASEQVPKDNPYIKGFIDKPFKSIDVLNALKDVTEIIILEQEQNSEKKRKRKESKSLFRKKDKKKVEMSSVDIEDKGLSFGTSYMIYESEPEKIYSFVGLFDPGKYRILMVSSEKAKAVRERFDRGTIDVVSLSPTQKSGTMDVHGLGSLMVYVNDFVKMHQYPVVVFDNFADLVEADGLNNVLVFFHQMISGSKDEATFVISVDDTQLTDKDENILKLDFKLHKF
ncbi:MAG: hypothetical protein ACI38Y_04270, partial [Candidatus Methanomethylophilaceae archaeon]